MTNIQWVNDMQDVLIRNQMYSAASILRQVGFGLIKSGYDSEIMSLRFFNEILNMKLNADPISDINWGVEKIMIRELPPYLREEKINKITNK